MLFRKTDETPGVSTGCEKDPAPRIL